MRASGFTSWSKRKEVKFTEDLRGTERDKIECGKAHFNALEVEKSPARYEVATSVDELLAGIGADRSAQK